MRRGGKLNPNKENRKGAKPSFNKSGKKPTFSRDNKGGERPYKRRPKPAPTAPLDGSIRLNKFLADAGIASRRQADELIKIGMVEVNGEMVTEMGYKVKPNDEVRYDGKPLRAEKLVYVVLNKPKGFITTTNDEKDRKTVMDLVNNASPYRIYPVGRLDRPTTGVLLFTNDGYLTKKLTHPSHGVKKIYHVTLDKSMTGADLDDIRENGVRMTEGVAKVDIISFIPGGKKNEIGVELHIGWNRVIRRIFEAKGYTVEKLDRVYFAGLTKKNIKRGQWKILTNEEIGYLKML